jgi:hypothetical protein
MPDQDAPKGSDEIAEKDRLQFVKAGSSTLAGEGRNGNLHCHYGAAGELS